VPAIVRIYRGSGKIDWNTYAIVAIIELARKVGQNPDVPAWLQEDYFRAIRELAAKGAEQLASANDPDTARAILAILALECGLRVYARILVNYSEDEISGIESHL